MGSFYSKVFKTTGSKVGDLTNTNMTIETLVDPRSPPGCFDRTPIIKKPYLETNFDISDSPTTSMHYSTKPWPLRKRILKNLNVDPRSPTIGLERSPIFVDTSVEESFEAAESSQRVSDMLCESAVSVYSCNVSQSDSLTNITAPGEPSAIVSDFEHEESIMPAYQEEFLRQIDNLTLKLSLDDLSKNETYSSDNSSLKTHFHKNEYLDLNKTRLEEAEFLINEHLLIDDSENIPIYSDQPISNTLKVKTSKNKVRRKKSDIPKPQSTLKVIKKDLSTGSRIPLPNSALTAPKPRTPLGNITSRGNTPCNNLRVKPAVQGIDHPGLAVEQKRVVAQWDQDNTVFI